MRINKNMVARILIAVMLVQLWGVNGAIAAAAEAEEPITVQADGPIRVNAAYGTTVRGGSHAHTPASTGSSTIPREIIEAKWAGDMSFSRRGHMEFNAPSDVNWEAVESIKLVMYLEKHSGSRQRDTTEVYQTAKSELSEENWTWNNTVGLMDNAVLLDQQTFDASHTGSWVEFDVTSLKDSLAENPEETIALAIYPSQQDDQAGIRFYSQHQAGGAFTPYLNIYEEEYIDVIPPNVTVTGLTDGVEVVSPELNFTVQAVDNIDAAPAIHLTVNNVAVPAVNGSNTITLTKGNNEIAISATDAAGNHSSVSTYSIKYTPAYTFPVIADTYVDIRSQNSNYNGSTEKGGLQLKVPVGGGTDRKVYVAYNLANNEAEYVSKAYLRLYAHELMGTDRTTEVVSIYEVPDFDETTLTWENASPNGEKVADAVYNRVAHNTWIELDITDYLNRKLVAGESIGRVNFVLEIPTGHDQKGVHLASKENFPEFASSLVLVEGLPAPTLEVTGIENHTIYTSSSIDDVAIAAYSVREDIAVTVEVEVNDELIAQKDQGLYDIPLQLGNNSIVITATDAEGNVTDRRYTVTRLGASEAGATYYVDSAAGNDDNDGLSADSPWQSLNKLNSVLFQPGSTILFKRGSIWNGQFRPHGSGEAGSPIIVDAYGEGVAKPIINGGGISNLDTGNGFAEGAVHLYNLSHWELNNLEVTNTGDTSPAGATRAGIIVVAGGEGYVEHVHIRDVYVHDVNSHQDAQKISGGIIFRGDTMTEKGDITDIPSGFRDILVEDSHIKDVAIEGLRTKTYRNGNDTGNIKNYDVVFRNNLIEEILGDGIVISEMESGGLVEKNIIRKHSKYSSSRNYAGLWLYQANAVTVQYNEVYDGVWGYNDGEAFDFDIGSTNNVYQYNYSHNNRGGLLLTMTSAGAGNVFRYNISQNDGHGTETFFVMNTQTAIYNNTIYIGEGTNVRYLVNDSNVGRVGGMFFKNNIVHVDGVLQNYSPITQAYDAPNVSHNLFYPAEIASLPGSPNEYDSLVLADAKLVDPAGDNEVMDTWTLDVWESNISKFMLQPDSPAINAGTTIDNPGLYDMFGTSLYQGVPDIGAHEYKEIDRADLEAEIDAATALRGEANPGDKPGDYPAEAIEALEAAIAAAEQVLANERSTQNQVNAAVEALQLAIAIFADSIITENRPAPTWPAPEQPVDPEEPGEPEEPVDPEQPGEPEQPEQPKVEFKDVPATHWAAAAIERAAGLGIVQGHGKGTFKPNASTTRAEFMTMLANAFKWQGEQTELNFSDNAAIGRWAQDAIAEGIKRGIITGYTDGSFRPNQEITRTEMIVMLARALDLSAADIKQTSFADDEAIPTWGKGAVKALYELGIIAGRTNNKFAPHATATRAEALVMLIRVLDKMN